VAEEPIQWKPPTRFQAGDSLVFQLSLPNWLPSDGWQVQLTVRKNTGKGSELVAQAVSVPDSSNAYHTFNVPQFLGDQSAGIYCLVLEVQNPAGNASINVAAGEQHVFYERYDFEVSDNLTAQAPVGAVESEAQAMIRILTHRLREIYSFKFSETESDRNRFNLKDEEKVLNSLKYWKEMRNHEIQIERVRNGQMPGNVVRPRFAVGC
jgi:hypothetical protein